MKFFLPFILIFLATNLSAQSYSFKQFEAGNEKPKAELIKEYIASNGESFKIGDEVFINEPSGNANTFQYIIKTELALKFNEIISSVLTREQAIAKLKESKDLLDLGMMSLEDYNKIKAELTPIIMND